jgi:heat shock protein HtpX
VLIIDREYPESFTVSKNSNAWIYLSEGLVAELSREQLEAVLAHEISHLVNRDSRIMQLLLLPVFGADKMVQKPDEDSYSRNPIGQWQLYIIVSTIIRISQSILLLGVTMFSRNRELAADQGAALLTGAPGTLATALQDLDEARKYHTVLGQDVTYSSSCLSIIPRGANAPDGLWRAHPRTDTRIERLESMMVEMETSGSN